MLFVFDVTGAGFDSGTGTTAFADCPGRGRAVGLGLETAFGF